MARRHSIVALVLLLGGPLAAAGQQAAAPEKASTPSPEASFSIFIQGTPVGREQVTVTSTSTGWIIRSSGRIGNPVNLTTSRFEVQYDREWRPVTLEIDATLRSQPLIVRTALAGGSARSDITQGGQITQKTDKVAADTVVLPNMFFGAYEALALRMQTVKLPADLRAYIAPQIEIALQVLGVADERIRTSDRTIAAKRYTIVFGNQDGPVPGEIWVDEDGRLLRFRMPTQALEVARGDVVAVSSRVERLGRMGDAQVFIPSNGFSLAGTISVPSTAQSAPTAAKAPVPRLPAVILVPGSGPADRDESIAGVPIFAQLANVLADAGFIVLRYDKRGIGQSGGRDESATIGDFADDVRAAVGFMGRRRDVDPKRIAIVGHSEGGMVGMLAASQMKKQVAALALLATPGTPGGELILEQQRYLLDRMSIPEAEKRNRNALQERIQVAALTGQGWETIPAAYRRQADTAWFRSFLAFRPNEILPKVEQPIAVIQGDRDRQVGVRHANLLIELANGRKKNAGAALFVIEGVNHLLVPATTGDVEDYPTLPDKNVSVKVLDALTSWLKDKLHVAAARAER
jgi:pimeloyl-ACP methyl ester carboxylesterase